jgi:hypothetical protein
MTEGLPGLLVDPSCLMIKKGFLGGYHYRRLNVSGSERFDDKPNKNRYSHVHDALQYALLGAGEGRRVMNHKTLGKPVVARRDFDPFEHHRKNRNKQSGKGWFSSRVG